MATQSSIKERTDNRIKEPKQYQVIMHNDDFTTTEFVVGVLVDIFHKDQANAEAIMLMVHKSGSAVVGVYPYDIARTKVDAALQRAESEGFPFRMTMEEA